MHFLTSETKEKEVNRQEALEQYRAKEQERFFAETSQENPNFEDFDYEDIESLI